LHWYREDAWEFDLAEIRECAIYLLTCIVPVKFYAMIRAIFIHLVCVAFIMVLHFHMHCVMSYGYHTDQGTMCKHGGKLSLIVGQHVAVTINFDHFSILCKTIFTTQLTDAH